MYEGKEFLESAFTESKKEKKCRSMKDKRNRERKWEKKRVRGIVWNVAGLKRKETDFWEFLKGFEIIGLTDLDREKRLGKVKRKDARRLEMEVPAGKQGV